MASRQKSFTKKGPGRRPAHKVREFGHHNELTQQTRWVTQSDFEEFNQPVPTMLPADVDWHRRQKRAERRSALSHV